MSDNRIRLVRARKRALVLSAVLALFMTPAMASAHPRLKRSSPHAAERLAVAPSVVRLWFSEVPELALTSLTLTNNAGDTLMLGAVARDDSGATGVRARVTQPIPPGTWTVRWHTAAADGHPTTGDFTFTVLPSASAVTMKDSAPHAPTGSVAARNDSGAPSVESVAPTASSAPFVVIRAALYLCILLVAGAVIFRATALRTGIPDAALAARIANSVATTGALAALSLALLAFARLALEVQLLNASAGTTATSAAAVVRDTSWGLGWQLQLAGAIAAMVSLFAARRSKAGWYGAAAASLLLVMTPALGGHAASAPRLTTLAIISDAGHVLGASGWLGGLLLLLLVAIPVVMRHGGATRWNDLAGAVKAFSQVALVCTALLVATGIFAAWLHLGSLAALWTSGYGRTLMLKLALISGMMAVGAFNWLRLRPLLGSEQSTQRLRRTSAIEVSFGVGVIIATAILVAIEPPVQ